MKKDCARQVAFGIDTFAIGGIAQLMAHIDDQPLRIVQIRLQRGHIDQGRPVHAASVSSSSHCRALTALSKTSTSAFTKVWESQALQVTHWLSVTTATRLKSSACARENLISSHATSSVSAAICERSKNRSTGPSKRTL